MIKKNINILNYCVVERNDLARRIVNTILVWEDIILVMNLKSKVTEWNFNHFMFSS